MLCGFQEGVEMGSGWSREANVIRETGRRVLGVSSGRKADQETRW